MSVHFFSEGIDFKLPHPRKTVSWLKGVVKHEKKSIDSINYIFCNDQYLLEINQQFLKHDTLTDIITFDYSQGNKIAGEIYISIERVIENARIFNATPERELLRVIVHGVLHLLGYSDKTKQKMALMRKKEDACLSLLNNVPHGTLKVK